MKSDLKIVGSSSKGNGYLLTCGNETLVIEMGVPIRSFRRAMDYDLSSVVGAICSHRHGDHAKYCKQFLNAGITIYSNKDVADFNEGVSVLELGKALRIKGFTIQAFELEHDVECYGYLIKHKELGKLVFLTDTCSAKYKFKDVNHILVEANYSEDIMVDKFTKGDVSVASKMRLSESHLSLEDSIDFLTLNNSDNLKTIVLLHLSDSNSNESLFVDKVMKAIKNPNIYVADKDMTVELNENGFF